jgi:hypothetical protein
MPIKRRNNLGEVDTISRNEQCFGSRMDPHSIGSVDPGPDSVRLPIQEGKNYIKKITYKKFHVLKCWTFSFEG